MNNDSPSAGLRVLRGGGEKRREPLESRDAVVRVLLEAGVDLLLRRISPERAEEIEQSVDHVLRLFDAVDVSPHFFGRLEKELDALEGLVREKPPARVNRKPGASEKNCCR